MSGHRARARRRQLDRERAARAARGGWTRRQAVAPLAWAAEVKDYAWSRPPGRPQDARRPSCGSRLRWVLSVAWTPWEAVVFVLVGVAIGAAGWGLQGALLAAGGAVVLWGAALLAALSCYQKD